MEGQSSGSPSEQQCFEIKLAEMLQDVEPPERYGFVNMQCIYRVQQRLRETNPKAYTPRIVSIGPFHKARDVDKEDKLESMEELKLKYLKGFLNRTQLPMNAFVVTLKSLEEMIRFFYAEPIKYNRDDFIKMILIDACFIIELFLRCNRYKEWEGKDPLLPKPWMLQEIYHDLILLENQLPFFVIDELYRVADLKEEFPSFLEITLYFFNIRSFGTVSEVEYPEHFTDLLRTSIISSSQFHLIRARKEIKHLYTASQLLEAGLKFKASSKNCLVHLEYHGGVLTMPILNIDDGTEILFRNIVAFEQSRLPHTPIIFEYLQILDYLINTEKDVNILVDNKIIVNRMGDANAVATMVNSLSSYVTMPSINSKHFSDLCNSLNDFYEKPRNKYKAIFIRMHAVSLGRKAFHDCIRVSQFYKETFVR
ncbi:UPF0481 protein, partial [Mucuna pruriens]